MHHHILRALPFKKLLLVSWPTYVIVMLCLWCNTNFFISGDGVGSILGYDALCRSVQYQSRHDSENSILDTDGPPVDEGDVKPTHKVHLTDGSQVGESGQFITEGLYPNRHLSAPAPRRRSSSTRWICVNFLYFVSSVSYVTCRKVMEKSHLRSEYCIIFCLLKNKNCCETSQKISL
jgi:hypothetical protein